MFAQRAARVGWGEVPCAAVQQFDAVQFFETADVLADGGWTHAQRLRGGVHAALFEDGGEGKQGAQIVHQCRVSRRVSRASSRRRFGSRSQSP